MPGRLDAFARFVSRLVEAIPAIGMARMPAADPRDFEACSSIALAERIRSGDSVAETEFVRRYSQWIRAVLLKRCGDMEMSRDLAQQTLMTVLVRLRERRLEEPEKLERFVYRTAVNLYINESRRNARRQTFPDVHSIDAAVEPGPSPLDSLASEQTLTEVLRLLATLPTERDKELLYRFYVLDHDKHLICRDLNLTSIHFNRVLYRARNRFKDVLANADASQMRYGRSEAVAE